MSLDAAESTVTMGRSAVDTLGNAQALFAGEVAAVPCIFKRRPVDASLGAGGLAAREITARFATSDLPASARQGAALSMYWGEQLLNTAGQYLVVRRTDLHERGATVLELEENLRP